MTAAPFVPWGTMTDTTDMGHLWRHFLPGPDQLTAPPEPAPVPQRLPRRLRRRAAGHLALALTAAAGFTTALLAGGVI